MSVDGMYTPTYGVTTVPPPMNVVCPRAVASGRVARLATLAGGVVGLRRVSELRTERSRVVGPRVMFLGSLSRIRNGIEHPVTGNQQPATE